MSAPIVPLLNPSEVNRNTILEIKLNGLYTPCGGLKNFDPTTDDANMEDDSRYSDGGYKRENKTGTGWSATATLAYASLVTDPTNLDPVLAYLISIEGNLGLDAQVDCRFYEYNPSPNSPRLYARQGFALVQYKGPGGDPNGNKEAQLTLNGQGKLNKITHPYPLTATAPYIASVQPLTGSTFATAGGTKFRIRGASFLGVTAVAFGGTAATDFQVWDNGEITGTAPAKGAGTVPVTVTNPAGTSTAFNVTYA